MICSSVLFGTNIAKRAANQPAINAIPDHIYRIDTIHLLLDGINKPRS